ncbi:hypothetical protein [Pseudobacteriovorax antillogorgiicola]|uniref:Uncharacterized protein n=1 Tax=Pseudobacteriovorax antillogorgiicola TaxID=1513793 RepID=A0A1Y6CQB6_9BACT|nr:hypothetical protein [Pseudobacteriovorax antillogorgiicola]TCS42114.1 hypothetical protein EDD56_1445 [Pseudobacteriovorax antillogorgiicola]SMF83051.1 hypothetical protein SAMN06296036_14413 [Pseudobacteriovorax antillogorgiicola]
MRVLLLSFLVAASSSALAGAKDDFIAAAEKQCGVSKDEAAKLATGGRTGSVIKFKLCLEPEQTLSNGCKLRCTKSGSKIGK